MMSMESLAMVGSSWAKPCGGTATKSATMNSKDENHSEVLFLNVHLACNGMNLVSRAEWSSRKAFGGEEEYRSAAACQDLAAVTWPLKVCGLFRIFPSIQCAQ